MPNRIAAALCMAVAQRMRCDRLGTVVLPSCRDFTAEVTLAGGNRSRQCSGFSGGHAPLSAPEQQSRCRPDKRHGGGNESKGGARQPESAESSELGKASCRERV